MILKEYRKYFETLIDYSKTFIERSCSFKGSFKRVLDGNLDPNFNFDYRYYSFTKSTKTLCSIYKLLEIGSYEDVIVLSRTMFECYLAQRYFDENFDHKTLKDMVIIPTAIFNGYLDHHNGKVVKPETGEEIEFDQRNPSNMILGKDNGYFYNLYYLMCENAHCNISQTWAFLDENNHFTLKSEGYAQIAHLLALFVFSKLFENIVLLEFATFDNAVEERDQVNFFKDLSCFIYDELDAFISIPEDDPRFLGRFVQKTLKQMKLSLKEQLGRVDKSFILDLEKQNVPTSIEEGLKAALLESEKPSAYFEKQRMKGKLQQRYFELARLIGLQQNPIHHPEGDVWTHTMQVLDRAAAFRDKVSDPYGFMLLALTHDFGKTVSTKEINGIIHSYGHENTGVPIAEEFLKRVTNNVKVRRYVLSMIPLHMKANIYIHDNSSIKATNRLFASVDHPEDLIYFAMSDKELPESSVRYLWDRYELYRSTLVQN